MAKIDRITEEGKEAIVDLLNKGIRVEYGMVLNYPRILDQIANIGKSQSEEFMNNAERFGKDSFRHSTIVAKLIDELGGEPEFEILTIDRMIDVDRALVEQLGMEKLAESLYKEARLIAQHNQAKAKGLFGKLMSIREEPKKDVSRSEVIERLKRLEVDEMGHIKRVEIMLLQIEIEPEKKEGEKGD